MKTAQSSRATPTACPEPTDEPAAGSLAGSDKATTVGSLLHGSAHLLCPIIFIVYKFFSEEADIQIMIYVVVAGIPISDNKLVARAVLL
ncbi:hypothetical protein KSP40_PGU005179 [Platanthera guangdongensis]|uniref:Uncharacterized protein n=1 Tax=Platanthera guangdongensis TaxID=2320717 RepID=A0ABR2N243_9ASPA